MSIAEKLQQIADNEQNVYDAGKKSQYDEFWDNYQINGTRTNYQGTFSGTGWNEIIFKPKYSMTPITCAQMFQSCKITDIEKALQNAGVTLDTSNATALLQMVQSSIVTVLPKIDATKSTNNNYAFSTNTLKIIRELVVTENSPFGNTFASGLEEIRITGTIGQNGFSVGTASKLSYESLMSIINALKDFTDTGETRTVTLGTANLAKLTDAEKAIATEKGWTLA